MRSALTSLLDLPWPIVAGWLVFLVLSTLQFVWFRRARVLAAVVQPPAPPRRARPRVPRQPAADGVSASGETLPAIDLDSITETNIAARSQTMLGL